MDAIELGRWTRFAAKGGIGKCTALQDCVAEQAGDLMFLKDDEITVLMPLSGEEDRYLGYCEGVVGRFSGRDVRFHARLKKPVMAKRSSTNPTNSRPSSSMSAATVGGRISPGMALRSSPSLQPRISRSQSGSTSVSVFLESSSMGAPSPSPAPLSPRTPPVQPLEESFEIQSVSNNSISTVLDPVSSPRTPSDAPKGNHTDPSKGREVHSPTDLAPDVTLQFSDKTLSPPGSPANSVKHISELSPTQHHHDANDTNAADLSTASESLGQDNSEHPSYMFSEPSTRISAAISDDGETGIGFALLQDFMNGGDDSDYSDEDPRSRASSPISMPSSAPPIPRQDEVQPVTGQTETSSIAESQLTTSPPMSFSGPLHPPPSPSIRSFMSRGNTDSEYGGEDWEGASDIYDNYRYSRYSVASKMSRFSRGSMHTVGSGIGLEVPPPVPVDSSRPSLDSIRPRFNSTESVPRRSVESSRQSPVIGPAENAAISSTASRVAESKHVPSPLTFAPEITSNHSQEDGKGSTTNSPLLHATFGSPGLSSNDEPLFSPPHPPSPPHATTSAAGAASALRQRLEMERESRPASPVAVSSSMTSVPDIPALNRQSHQPIIVEDAHEERVVMGSASPSTSTTYATSPSPNSAMTSISASSSTSAPSPTPTSPRVSEKMAMRSQLVVMNPNPNAAPPPPYTPTSPPATSSSHSHLSASASIPPASPMSSVPPSPGPMGQPQLRPAPSQPVSPNARQSLFLPHPHAPKPTSSSAGPLYGRVHQGSGSGPSPPGTSSGSLLHTIQMALSSRYDALGRPRRTTIYGKLEQDLAVSIGPVPISFTLEPPNNIPANRINSLANRPSTSSLRSPTPQSPQVTHSPPLPASTPPVEVSSPEPSRSAPPPEDTSSSTSKVIPRANFFPKAPTARPRSRSFSGFDSPFAEIELPKDEKGRSSEDSTIQTRSSMQTPPLQMAKRSKSTSASVSSVNVTPQRASVSHSHAPLTARSVTHRPSPLSLSQNNIVASPTTPTVLKSPTTARIPRSPLAAPPAVVSKSTDSNITTSDSQSDGTPLSPVSMHQPSSPVMSKTEAPPAGPSSGPSAPARHLRHSRSSISHKGSAARDQSPPSRASLQGRRSGDTDASYYSDARSIVSSFSPPLSTVPLGRSGSLRSKLSLPTLRIRSSSDRPPEDIRSPTSSLSPSEEQRTVQVKDMDFELVQPTAALSPSTDDISQSLHSPSRTEHSSFLRAGSPALSTLSASTSRSRQTSTLTASPVMQANKSLEGADVEAHRQRELKWISSMSSIPASQARKNKKIRKLLQDGVPSSVRYLVWAHLTDSRSKRVDKIYDQLGKRERVAASPSIERDIEQYAVDHPSVQPQLLNNLLQAYLIMVPDVQYSSGLTRIAGCLLALSPEEDAFWTFISLMDTHIRPYFSSNGVQLEVDAVLFGKAAETHDSIAAKRVFVDMAIHPVQLCRSWFCSLFVDALPPDYQYRVWDIFLFEGVVFLFRVGVAILSCCKRIIMETTGRDDLVRLLSHPPTTVLPASPEAFLEMVFAVKLKDDDIRKLRNKREAQAKRQTQPRSMSAQPGISMPSISLPKA